MHRDERVWLQDRRHSCPRENSRIHTGSRMKKFFATLLFLLTCGIAHAQTVSCNPAPFIFQPGTTISSSQGNADFAAIVACVNNIPIGTTTVVNTVASNPSNPTAPPQTVVTVNILTSYRNRLLNDCMAIDQRNSGAAQTGLGTSTGTYTVDRFFYKGDAAQVGRITAQQITVGPTGGPPGPGGGPFPGNFPCSYAESLKVTTAASPAAGDFALFGQNILASNVTDWNFGNANASPVTLSFWALGGTGALAGSGSIVLPTGGYSYVFNYSTGATWTHVTVPIPAITIAAVAGSNINVYLSLGCGTTFQATPGSWTAGTFYCSGVAGSNFINTTGQNIYFTGLQLEAGAQATPLEIKPATTELALVQPYFQQVASWQTGRYTKVGGTIPIPSFTLNIPMIAQPTAAAVTPSFTNCTGLTLTPVSITSVNAALTGCTATTDVIGAAAAINFTSEITP